MSYQVMYKKDHQEYRSYLTSVNTKKLPKIYNKINWADLFQQVSKDCVDGNPPVVLDVGCGRETSHIRAFVNSFGFDYLPYDPYWLGKAHNAAALYIPAEVVICSNVLNVIKEDDIVKDVHHLCQMKGGKYYYITVYEGNQTGIGKESKKDCWQRNQKLASYCNMYEIIKHGVLTSGYGAWFIK